MGSGLMKPVVEYRIRGRFVSFWPRRDYKHSLDREFVEKSLWDLEEQQAAALESQILVEVHSISRSRTGISGTESRGTLGCDSQEFGGEHYSWPDSDESGPQHDNAIKPVDYRSKLSR